MTHSDDLQTKSSSPFYCFAVGISPEQGRRRVVLARFNELRNRNAWLVNLRWLAAAGLAAATTVARCVLKMSVDAPILYSLAGVLFLYNLILRFLVSRKAEPAGIERELDVARFVAVVQIAIDLVILTVMLHYSGGAENPFFFYFVFHMIIGSILLTERASFRIATLGVLLFSGLILLEYFGVIGHTALWSTDVRLYANGTYLAAVLVVFISTMYLSVYFAASIVEKLRARDTELIGVTSSLEKGSLELAEAYERIRALEERKSDFLRLVSHQLRSPLSAIRSLLDVVLDGYAGDAHRQREMLQRAHDRADLMLAMVNDLLSLSRLKDAAGGQPQAPEPVDVCAIAAELMAFYRPRADGKKLRLEMERPQSPCTVLAAADDVRQALDNLLDNAINYTPEGGAVSVLAQTRAGVISLGVSDTGIGIPQDAMNRLFDEFYRAPNAKGMRPLGTGLGLAIVKRVVERWHGKVAVDSKVGAGTTVTLEFPAA